MHVSARAQAIDEPETGDLKLPRIVEGAWIRPAT